ncbi:MAG: response regulator [Planctomycetaceae bacterium]|jgi:FixJ family two-component response regulator
MVTTLAQPVAQEIAGLEPESLARVYVIDDEIQVLEIVEIQLKAAGFDVLTFSSPELFLQQLPGLAPGVVLSDQRMPCIDGLEVQRRLRQRPNDFKLILLSGFPETRVVVEAMRQGAVNVLDKPYEKEEMLMSLRTAFSALRRSMVEDTRLPERLPDGRLYLETLSQRERGVIDLIYRGETNKSIGITLGISVKTVEKHRGKAMRKMQASCLADLIRLIDRELPEMDR